MGSSCSSCDSCSGSPSGAVHIYRASAFLLPVSFLALIFAFPVDFLGKNGSPDGNTNIICQVLLIIASVIGLMTNCCPAKSLVWVAFITALSGLIVNCVALAIDVVVVVKYLDVITCTNSLGTSFYGSTSTASNNNAKACSNAARISSQAHDCICATSSSTTCTYIDGNSDCTGIFSVYTPLYKASIFFEVLTLAISFAFVVIVMMSIFCPKQFKEEKDDPLLDESSPLKSKA